MYNSKSLLRYKPLKNTYFPLGQADKVRCDDPEAGGRDLVPAEGAGVPRRPVKPSRHQDQTGLEALK